MSDTDLFGEKVYARTPTEIKRDRRRANSRPRGHAAPPGSGPDGDTCGSCGHIYYFERSKRYYKCGLVKPTHGSATDLRKRDLACSRWVPQEGQDK